MSFIHFQTIVLSFIFGAFIGSFLNVLIWRMPRGQQATGRSQCVNCGKQLNWYELMPVLSFAVQRGKCRGCGEAISFRYPVIELVTAGLFAVSAFLFPPQDWLTSLVYIKVLYVVAIAIIVFMVDWEHYLILDRVLFPAALTLFLLNALIDLASGRFLSLSGMLVGGTLSALLAMLPLWFIWRLSGGRWLGLGDVKFMGLIGLAVGPIGAPVAFFVAVAVGTILSIPLLLLGKKTMQSQLPFGTFLAVGLVAAIWWGELLARSYWNLVWPG